MRSNILKLSLAALLTCAALDASAERGAARTEPVSAPVPSGARGANAAAGVDSKQDPKQPDWLMVLAGLAVAGWIAQRRIASPLE